MVSDKEYRNNIIKIVLALFVFLTGANLVSDVFRTVDEIEYRATEPKQMNMHVGGIIAEKSTIFGYGYYGYNVKTTIINNGKSGYANITCNAYDQNNIQVSSETAYPYPHFERDANTEVTFYFDSDKLPDGDYNFNIVVSDQLTDS
ncbi:hypothetical protein [Methanolobus vulcani]|uniref:CARDB domain-containing protein n=1 Tax=Methanolobus vulcani TaxID=38026 RepID=A0A7Z8P4J8_9EURY|nr:hypothetical protein [Methanolobus vulcani]TQD24978.1 hypothetical protein FKV42_07890 [Methanolobus vulcani]